MAKRLRTTDHPDRYISFWCFGCSCYHSVPTEGPHRWNWNGNTEAPTLTPSVLMTWRPAPDADPADLADTSLPQRCHIFVTDGKIQYLSDCTHSRAGQTVDMREEP